MLVTQANQHHAFGRFLYPCRTPWFIRTCREHPPHFDGERGLEQRQINAMQMPATPDQRRFYSALLFELGAPQSASATLAQLERVARDLLRRMAPRMLIVDEVHHLLAGSHIEQRASLNLLKYPANDLRISVVAVGTSDAPLALRTDPQMSSRFTPFEMPRWTESDDFRRLLRAFEQVLPLRRASDLVQRPVVQFLISASGGTPWRGVPAPYRGGRTGDRRGQRAHLAGAPGACRL
jgi:hypothetical protein